MPDWKSRWWFQPIWKILVNLDHFPKYIEWKSKKYVKPPTRNISEHSKDTTPAVTSFSHSKSRIYSIQPHVVTAHHCDPGFPNGPSAQGTTIHQHLFLLNEKSDEVWSVLLSRNSILAEHNHVQRSSKLIPVRNVSRCISKSWPAIKWTWHKIHCECCVHF